MQRHNPLGMQDRKMIPIMHMSRQHACPTSADLDSIEMEQISCLVYHSVLCTCVCIEWKEWFLCGNYVILYSFYDILHVTHATSHEALAGLQCTFHTVSVSVKKCQHVWGFRLLLQETGKSAKWAHHFRKSSPFSVQHRIGSESSHHDWCKAVCLSTLFSLLTHVLVCLQKEAWMSQAMKLQ